jgi:hypothetical protein
MGFGPSLTDWRFFSLGTSEMVDFPARLPSGKRLHNYGKSITIDQPFNNYGKSITMENQ